MVVDELMLPSNEVRVPTMRVVSQSVVPRDITDVFTQAASSKKPVFVHCLPYTFLFDQLSAALKRYTDRSSFC
jgi:mitochondrial fission protein ELM1